MRKLISQIMMSLDSYFEGPNRQIDWHNVDEEYSEYAAGLLGSVDAIIWESDLSTHEELLGDSCCGNERSYHCPQYESIT